MKSGNRINGDGLWNDAVNKKLKEAMRIDEKAKVIAQYMGHVYIPFNDLQGFPKAGWYEIRKFNPNPKEIILPTGERGTIDFSLIAYKKNGWTIKEDIRYRYVCRKHSDLRYYNSMDALLPVIKKLEKEDLSKYHYEWEMGGEMRNNFEGIEFTLFGGGGYACINLCLDPPIFMSDAFDKDLSWTQNVFKLVYETIEYINNVKTKEDVRD